MQIYLIPRTKYGIIEFQFITEARPIIYYLNFKDLTKMKKGQCHHCPLFFIQIQKLIWINNLHFESDCHLIFRFLRMVVDRICVYQ